MNISTLAKILGISINDLRTTGQKNHIYGFYGRNTRIPYNSAVKITEILKPDKLSKLKNDDKIYLPPTIRVSEFAETIGKPSGIVLKNLILNGVMATLNEKIDYDTASLIAEEMGVPVEPENPDMFEIEAEQTHLIKTLEYSNVAQEDKEFITRNPVVTVMGHVDHGKTTLLDTIRKTNVAAKEAGAITQHIASYKIKHKDKEITFVDTPGHEAFTAMRARGSQLADFVILMVSAVEGPKPQTVEVIERCKMSKVQMIVALNKIDLPDSDVERTKADLAKFGVVPEDWGGNTPFIEISAKNNINIDKLLDTVLLFAELADLKGEVKCPGQGVVIESHLDRNMGVISTILVVKDVLKVGDIIRCSEYVGKVRKLETSEGKTIQEAKIGDPVLLIGLPEVMDIGEAIVVYKSQRQAQTDASIEKTKRNSRRINKFVDSSKGGKKDQINVVIKADVSGSLEALKEAIIKTPQEHAKIVIKQESVGEVNESDVEFAHTSDATILAFHTKLKPSTENLLKKLQVNLVQSDVIYHILEWIEEEILKHIKHEVKTIILGKAEILATFKSEKPSIQIMGGEVKEGKLFSNKPFRISREGKEIGKGEVQELQKNKDKVSEVNISQQFGISVISKTKLKKGDIIESFDEEIVK